VVFLFIAIEYFRNAPDDFEMTFFGNFCFWFTILIDLPICLALVGLTLNIFVQIYEN